MAITLEDLASVVGEQQKTFANLFNLVSSLHSISLELSARQAATEAVLAQLASLLLTWLSDDPARFLGELRSKFSGTARAPCTCTSQPSGRSDRGHPA